MSSPSSAKRPRSPSPPPPVKRQKLSHNAVPKQPHDSTPTISGLENLPIEIFDQILDKLIGASDDKTRRGIKEQPDCPGFHSRYVLDTSILSLNKGINAAAKRYMSLDQWVIFEFDTELTMSKHIWGLVPMQIVDRGEEHLELPSGIMHVRIKMPYVSYRNGYHRETILIQERHVPLFLRLIRIIELRMYISFRAAPGSLLDDGGKDLIAEKGAHRFRFIVNVHPDAPEKRVKPLLKCFRQFGAWMNRISIAGAPDAEQARSIEQSIIGPADARAYEYLGHRYFLKVHADEICSEQHASPIHAAHAGMSIGSEWLYFNRTPGVGNNPQLPSSDHGFHSLATAGEHINWALIEVSTRKQIFFEDRLAASRFAYGTPSMWMIWQQAIPFPKAYTSFLVGLHMLYCARFESQADEVHIKLMGLDSLHLSYEILNLQQYGGMGPDFRRECMKFSEEASPLLSNLEENRKKLSDCMDTFHDWFRGLKLKPVKFVVNEGSMPQDLKDRGILDVLPKYDPLPPSEMKFVLFEGFLGSGQGDDYLL